MKINIWIIINDHFLTLRNANRKAVSYTDVVIFIFIPGIFSLLAYGERLSFSDDIFSLAVTFFGVFIALLLNMQVAIFGIYQARRTQLGSIELTETKEERDKLRKTLMIELNASLSYLTLVSTVALVVSFCAVVMKIHQGFLIAVSVFFYAHFVLTLLMILKRSYILFKKELT